MLSLGLQFVVNAAVSTQTSAGQYSGSYRIPVFIFLMTLIF